jgi:hypothetical protein
MIEQLAALEYDGLARPRASSVAVKPTGGAECRRH